jgi:hypothetical protein
MGGCVEQMYVPSHSDLYNMKRSARYVTYVVLVFRNTFVQSLLK